MIVGVYMLAVLILTLTLPLMHDFTVPRDARVSTWFGKESHLEFSKRCVLFKIPECVQRLVMHASHNVACFLQYQDL